MQWRYSSLLFSLEEDYRLEAVQAATQHNPQFQSLIIDAFHERGKRETYRARFRITYRELKQRSETDDAPDGARSWAFRRRWGQDASDDDLRQAAEDLLHEHEIDQLLLYLGAFQKRQFPLDATVLIAKARSCLSAFPYNEAKGRLEEF